MARSAEIINEIFILFFILARGFAARSIGFSPARAPRPPRNGAFLHF